MLAAMKNQKTLCAQNIRALRKSNGLTQAKLGELLNKEATVISSWETGAVAPSAKSIFKLAALFKVPATNFGASESIEHEQSTLMPTIVDVMEVLDGFKNAPKDKREAVLTILGKKNDGTR